MLAAVACRLALLAPAARPVSMVAGGPVGGIARYTDGRDGRRVLELKEKVPLREIADADLRELVSYASEPSLVLFTDDDGGSSVAEAILERVEAQEWQSERDGVPRVLRILKAPADQCQRLLSWTSQQGRDVRKALPACVLYVQGRPVGTLGGAFSQQSLQLFLTGQNVRPRQTEPPGPPPTTSQPSTTRRPALWPGAMTPTAQRSAAAAQSGDARASSGRPAAPARRTAPASTWQLRPPTRPASTNSPPNAPTPAAQEAAVAEPAAVEPTASPSVEPAAAPRARDVSSAYAAVTASLEAIDERAARMARGGEMGPLSELAEALRRLEQ